MGTYELSQTQQFESSLRRLDRQVAHRMLRRLYALAELDTPQVRCKPWSEELGGLWCLSVDDYPVILDIQDGALVIIVLDPDPFGEYRQQERLDQHIPTTRH